MSAENTHESYVDRFPFMSADSRRSVLKIVHLFDEITELSRKNIELTDKKNRIIAIFYKDIKSYCLKRYGKEKLWEQVPEVQKLIGGSIEERIDITDEQFDDISNQALSAIENIEALLVSVD